jgi:hypothetical protein
MQDSPMIGAGGPKIGTAHFQELMHSHGNPNAGSRQGAVAGQHCKKWNGPVAGTRRADDVSPMQPDSEKLAPLR